MSNPFNAQLIVTGASCGTKESRNERGQVTGHTVQLVKRSAKNAVEVLAVRLPEGADPEVYAEGKYVELPIDISSFEGTLYYRATRETVSKPSDSRTTESGRAAAPPPSIKA